ncbi:MAG: ferredoxin [Fibrobacterota bacterium]
MEIKIEESKCRSAGVCVKDFPGIFGFAPGNKKAFVLEGINPVPPNLERMCINAAERCPEKAISIIS